MATISVLLEKCHWIHMPPRSVVAYSTEVVRRAVPIWYRSLFDLHTGLPEYIPPVECFVYMCVYLFTLESTTIIFFNLLKI